ncbi:MAG TPA: hypothetical protein VNQ90_11300 [Chthoniobacteraceae bacterium]|nr:hypothetical protein [Chthoniobacteraceae bacterium]
MSRAITFLGIFQVVCLVIGHFALGMILKLHGYPNAYPGAQWSPLALFLRTHGALLLVIPGLWTFFAVVLARRNRGLFSEKFAMLAGVAISIALILSFLYAAAFPYGRALPILRSTTP